MTPTLRTWLACGLGLFASISSFAAAGQANKWEGEMAGFERQDRERPPEPGGVVFYGSSSFRLWTNLAASFPDCRLVNRGFGGSQTSDLVEHFERTIPQHQPRLLLIYGGDNDLAAGKSPETVLADFRRLVEMTRRRLPQTRIAFVAVKPSPSRLKLLSAQREANRLVQRFARWRRSVDFVDAATPLLGANGEPDARWYAADRLHLNGDGYQVWTRVLGPYLARWK